MLNIAICDDEKLHRDYTEKIVARETAGLAPEIDTFSGADDLLRRMELGDYTPDIAILDIQMAGTDGISLAKRLNDAAPHCQIIFLTSYLSFATDVYEAEHVYFLLKSELETRIGAALKKATAALTAGRSAVPCITAGTRTKAVVFPVADVLLLERVGRRTRLAAVTGDHWTTLSPRELLTGEAAAQFIRCHQSYWVNAAKIVSLANNEFTLADGTRVPLSRSFRAQARSRFFALLHGSSEA